MSDSPFAFFLCIERGYLFRNGFAPFRAGSPKEISMTFTPDQVDIVELPNQDDKDNDNWSHNRIIIHTAECNEYIFNPKNVRGESMSKLSIRFKVESLTKTIKQLTRSDGIVFYCRNGTDLTHGNKNRYYYYIMRSRRDSTPDTEIEFNISTSVIIVNDARFGSDTLTDAVLPNVSIDAKLFSELCAQAISRKCQSVRITCYDDYAIWNMSNSSGDLNTNHVFDPKENSESRKLLRELDMKIPARIKSTVDICCITIPIRTIRAVAKINNASVAPSLLDFYSQHRGMMKIVAPIGGCATYILTLYSKEDLCEDSEEEDE